MTERPSNQFRLRTQVEVVGYVASVLAGYDQNRQPIADGRFVRAARPRVNTSYLEGDLELVSHVRRARWTTFPQLLVPAA